MKMQILNENIFVYLAPIEKNSGQNSTTSQFLMGGHLHCQTDPPSRQEFVAMLLEPKRRILFKYPVTIFQHYSIF